MTSDETIEAELVDPDDETTDDLIEYGRQNRGKIQIVDAETDQQLVEMWIRSQRSEHTKEAYRRDWEEIRSYLGKPIRWIMRNDLQDLERHYREDVEDVQSDSTIERKMMVIKSLLTYAHNVGYTAINVGVDYQPDVQKTTRSAKDFLTREELWRLFEAAGDGDEYICRLLYYTAARVTEAVQMDWGDWGTIDDSWVVSISGKGKKDREMPISEDQWGRIVAFRPDDYEGDDPCLVDRNGERMSRHQVAYAVKRAADQADLDKSVTPHSFRHAHATHAIANGCPLTLLQERLGHEDPETTGKYAHAQATESSAKYLGD